MSGNRAARVLQGPRGQSIRHPGFELSHAHERGRPAQGAVRPCGVRGHPGSGSRGRSAEIPRRAPLCRAAQGRPLQDRARGRSQARLRPIGRPAGDRRRPGLRFSGRLARHGRRRGGDHRIGNRNQARNALHPVRGLGRRPHAGGYSLADAAAAYHGGSPGTARGEEALHRRAHQPDHRRRDRLLCDARRRAHRRAGSADRLCRSARDRADHSRKAARRLPARRISQGSRHGGSRRASSPVACDAGAPVPRADQGAGAERCGGAAGSGVGVSARAQRDDFVTPVDAIVARLLALHPKRIDLSLDRVLRLLERLGHPQQRLPPVVHVGGTNGKGSTIAFLRAMLEAAGRTVHVYTSPNLVRVNERFRLGRPSGGVLVSDAALADALSECERANAGSPITVFEITTAAGLLLFSRQPADMLLLEVGLGGRLDATNVVERPAATVITSVSLDHVEYLGDSIVKIAAEKAGILKPGVPPAMAGEHWLVSQEHGRLVYQDEHGLLDLPRPRLFGRHQLDNAGTAIAALRSLGDAGIGAAAFETGLLKVDWPARLQRLTAGRLPPLAPEGGELWLDGAHNPEGGRAVAAAIADMEERVPRPLVLVVGMLATKDLEGFLRNFAGLARRLIAVPIHQENTLPPDAIAAAARRIGIPAEVSDGIEPALAGIARLDVEASPRILITGSLYLAGEVLAQNGTLPS